MLTVETRRHIDNARQVLVGKVPDPKQQIDQITNALIYKFMDDMDVKAKDAGGKASFFVEDLEQYAWRKLMDPRKGAQERLNMYTEALEKFSTAQQLPQLFRDIFRQAFLPYRDPETLNLFLKEIEFFDYNHSEELGNAFEYLLSIMGSQGDAGQFRTPRHIIDFIVDIIDPDKDDKILDPACGTAGFLISAYKHIVEKHDGIDESGKKNDEKPLTHSEKQKLMNNLEGYDISSDMVKLARVNMYLHGNNQPKIYEYDSLSSEERWSDSFDVILANPPFMSPKGGIRPHNKFGVESSRAEVLFVDYIMSHLKQNGRAGIIVPEGIIFQSGKAYKQLRKNLVEDGLLAVVSLPAGVFNPYAGVKTSILIFDNDRSKKSDQIVFAKVEKDGFDLGAQRRPASGKDDLPYIAKMLRTYREDPKSDIKEVKTTLAKSNFFTIGKSTIGGSDKIGSPSEVEQIEITSVRRAKIAESGDYNLSASRYIETIVNQNQKWPMVKLGELIKQDFGVRITKSHDQGTKYPVYGGGGQSFFTDTSNRQDELVISRFAMSEKCVRKVKGKFHLLDSGFTFHIQDEFRPKVSKAFVDNILLNVQDRIYACARGHAQKNIDNAQFSNLEIPLPPIEVQKQIAEELDSYQKIIDGARQVIENYKPTIKIDHSWPTKKLGELASFSMGGTPSQAEINSNSANIPWVKGSDLAHGFIRATTNRITDKGMSSSRASYYEPGTVLVGRTGQGKTRGTVAFLKIKATTNETMIGIFTKQENLNPEYLYYYLISQYRNLRKIGGENSRGGLTQRDLNDLALPVPSLDEQNKIIVKLRAEHEMIDSSKQLAKLYEKKIKDKITEVWGAK